MSMRDSNTKLTICEVLRQANDRLQRLDVDVTDIMDCLALAEFMAKKMSAKLQQYNAEYDKEFWKDNAQYEQGLRRKLEEYVVGDPERAMSILERMSK